MLKSDSDTESESFESAEENFEDEFQGKTKETSAKTTSKESDSEVTESVVVRRDPIPQGEKDAKNSLMYRKRPERVKREISKSTSILKKVPPNDTILKPERVVPEAFFQDITMNLSKNINKSLNTMQQTSSNIMDLVLNSLPAPGGNEKEVFSYDEAVDIAPKPVSKKMSKSESILRKSHSDDETESVPCVDKNEVIVNVVKNPEDSVKEIYIGECEDLVSKKNSLTSVETLGSEKHEISEPPNSSLKQNKIMTLMKHEKSACECGKTHTLSDFHIGLDILKKNSLHTTQPSAAVEKNEIDNENLVKVKTKTDEFLAGLKELNKELDTEFLDSILQYGAKTPTSCEPTKEDEEPKDIRTVENYDKENLLEIFSEQTIASNSSTDTNDIVHALNTMDENLMKGDMHDMTNCKGEKNGTGCNVDELKMILKQMVEEGSLKSEPEQDVVHELECVQEPKPVLEPETEHEIEHELQHELELKLEHELENKLQNEHQPVHGSKHEIENEIERECEQIQVEKSEVKEGWDDFDFTDDEIDNETSAPVKSVEVSAEAMKPIIPTESKDMEEFKESKETAESSKESQDKEQSKNSKDTDEFKDSRDLEEPKRVFELKHPKDSKGLEYKNSAEPTTVRNSKESGDTKSSVHIKDHKTSEERKDFKKLHDSKDVTETKVSKELKIVIKKKELPIKPEVAKAESQKAKPPPKRTRSPKKHVIDRRNLSIKGKKIPADELYCGDDEEEEEILEEPVKPATQTKRKTHEEKEMESEMELEAEIQKHKNEASDVWDWDSWDPLPEAEDKGKGSTKSESKSDDFFDDASRWSGWDTFGQKQEEKGNWNLGSWGSSLLTKATSVTQGISTVLEAGLGAPDPETLARMEKLREKTSPEKPIQEEKDTQEVANAEPTKKTSLTEGNLFPVFGITNLVAGVTSKIVEHTKIQEIGSKVLIGGLDTLESFGKKTMEVLQEGDPGLKKKRAILMGTNKPVLSQVLKEAREKADEEMKKAEEKEMAKKCHFEALFDDYQGMVHLEALEMLSWQCEMKLEQIKSGMNREEQEELEGILEEVEQLCSLDEDDTDVRLSTLSDFKISLNMAVTSLKDEISVQKILQVYEEAEKWLQKTSETKPTSRMLHQKVVSTVAELTAATVHQFHKVGELLSVKERRKTVEEAEALSKMTCIVCLEINKLCVRFITLSKEIIKDEITSDNGQPVADKIDIIMKNSTSYIKQAFNLLVPIVQIGAAV